MPYDTNKDQICAYFMRHGTIKGESGVTTTQAGSNAASDTFRDNQIKERPLLADEQLCAPPIQVGKEAGVMKDDDNKLFDGVPAVAKALGMALEAKPGRTLQIDTTKYQAYLDDPELSDAQKEQIVQALWKIILCFVDLGYGVSPLEQACGQLIESKDQGGNPDSNLLRSEDTTLSDTFNLNAAG